MARGANMLMETLGTSLSLLLIELGFALLPSNPTPGYTYESSCPRRDSFRNAWRRFTPTDKNPETPQMSINSRMDE